MSNGIIGNDATCTEFVFYWQNGPNDAHPMMLRAIYVCGPVRTVDVDHCLNIINDMNGRRDDDPATVAWKSVRAYLKRQGYEMMELPEGAVETPRRVPGEHLHVNVMVVGPGFQSTFPCCPECNRDEYNRGNIGSRIEERANGNGETRHASEITPMPDEHVDDDNDAFPEPDDVETKRSLESYFKNVS